MNKSTMASFLGMAISLGFLYGWCATAPVVGSGWLLFVAIITAFGVLNHQRTHEIAMIGAVIMTAAFGAGWYYMQPLQFSGWLLFTSILCGLRAMQSIYLTMERPD